MSRRAVWLWSRCSHQCERNELGNDDGDGVARVSVFQGIDVGQQRPGQRTERRLDDDQLHPRLPLFPLSPQAFDPRDVVGNVDRHDVLVVAGNRSRIRQGLAGRTPSSAIGTTARTMTSSGSSGVSARRAPIDGVVVRMDAVESRRSAAG